MDNTTLNPTIPIPICTTQRRESDQVPGWLGLLTQGLWNFRTAVLLCAAAKARLSILVSGPDTRANSALLRTLGGFVDPEEDQRRLATAAAAHPGDAIKVAAAAGSGFPDGLPDTLPVHAAFDLVVQVQPGDADHSQITEIVWLRKRMGPGDRRRVLWQKSKGAAPSLDPFAAKALFADDHPDDKRLGTRFVEAFPQAGQLEAIKSVVTEPGDEEITARSFRVGVGLLQGETFCEDVPFNDREAQQVVSIAGALEAWEGHVKHVPAPTVPAGFFIENRQGRKWAITRQPWYIGRSQNGAGADTTLDAELGARYIHQQHCKITFDLQRGSWLITRLGSSRGTDVVGKQRLGPGESVDLDAGDELRLAAGRVRLWFRKE